MQWNALSTREWATIFWALVIFVLLVAVPGVRSTFVSHLCRFLRLWEIHLALLAFLVWEVLVLYTGRLVGAWNSGLLKDTIFWLLIYSLPTLFSASKSIKENRFFRRAMVSTLSFTALMQFILNLHTFPVWVEVILQPTVTFVLLIGMFAAVERETAPVSKFMNGLLGVIGIWVIIGTAQGLWESWGELDAKQVGLSLAFSIWFPMASIPFVYFFAKFLSYDEMFSRMSRFNEDYKKPSFSVRGAVVIGLRGRHLSAEDLRRHSAQLRSISRARGFRSALRSVRALRTR